MNPLDVLRLMSGKENPKNIAMKMAKETSNPMIINLIEMAEKGDNKGVEQFARNLCKEKGINFDKEIKNFSKNFQ